MKALGAGADADANADAGGRERRLVLCSAGVVDVDIVCLRVESLS